MEETRKPARKRAPAAPKPAAKAVAKTAKSAAPAKPAARKKVAKAVPTQGQRDEMVRMAAYFRAEQRGFAPGNEWEDWLAAEAEVSALVQAPAAPPRKVPARKTPKA